MANPSLARRLGLAWRVLNQGLPGARKSSPLLWPSWREGQPQWQIVDMESYINEGFNVNSVIYSSIMYKARSVTAAKLTAYRGDPKQPDELDPSEDLARVIARPNAYQSREQFWQQSTVYLNVAGNNYIYLDRPSRGATPTQMKNLRPDRVHIVPVKRNLIGYLYCPEGQTPIAAVKDGSGVPILPEDMVHTRLPNPGDPLEGYGYGLSPISALARSGDVDNAITQFLQVFFQRGTNVGYVMSFDRELDPAEIARIRERWKETYGGWQNWDEIGVLDSGGKMERLTMGFNEMGFETMDQRSETRIMGPFGVPPILIGSRVGLDRSTMANYAEARRQFWEDTLIPELSLYEGDLDHNLTGADPDTFVRFDTSGVPALRQDTVKQVESVYKLWTMGVPVNQAARTIGLPMDPVPGGDQGWIPGTLVPGDRKPVDPVDLLREQQAVETQRLDAEREQRQSLAEGRQSNPKTPKGDNNDTDANVANTDPEVTRTLKELRSTIASLAANPPRPIVLQVGGAVKRISVDEQGRLVETTSE